ncbi:MAG: sugar phosphate isomerase/epimerase [Vallitalea sp.]|jgi:2-keto-myo-inositol isomerase|nr:sugar phosphate isomerase/epimerase [Vallitalea sp.]
MRKAINEATTMETKLKHDLILYAEAGFEGVELWWDKIKDYLKENSVDDLKNLIKSTGLEIASICPFLVSPFRNQLNCRDEFKKALKVADQIGCELIVICPDFQPIEYTREKALAMHADELKIYCEEAATHGIKLAMEPIGLHTLLSGPKDAEALIKLAGNPDNLGYLMDTFHYAKSGITPEEVSGIDIEKLWIVHVNDSVKGMMNELEDKDRVYPTKGVLPLKAYMDALRKIGYKGFLSVETFNQEYWKEDAKIVSVKAYEAVTDMLAL